MAMPPERVTHSIQFLTGEVHALFLFAQALAKTHSNLSALQTELDAVEQLGLAHLEMLPVRDDAVIDGYRFAIDGIRKAAAVPAGIPYIPTFDPAASSPASSSTSSGTLSLGFALRRLALTLWARLRRRL